MLKEQLTLFNRNKKNPESSQVFKTHVFLHRNLFRKNELYSTFKKSRSSKSNRIKISWKIRNFSRVSVCLRLENKTLTLLGQTIKRPKHSFTRSGNLRSQHFMFLSDIGKPQLLISNQIKHEKKSEITNFLNGEQFLTLCLIRVKAPSI